MNNEKRIIDAWRTNAEAWVDAIVHQGIRAPGTHSREAILDAINAHAKPPARILDAGCGEGWLVGVLANAGFDVTGVDACHALIDYGRQKVRARFEVGDLANLKPLALGMFDLIVCNFSLFGEASVRRFVQSVPSLLDERGTCIIQTLHPLAFFGPGNYRSQWREGTWAGLPGHFSDPAPWYFRTLSDWAALFRDAGCRIVEIRESGAEPGRVETIVFVIEAG
jgi:2-polyprenyl-3-methyl-5-hydroxy-6-metoxy-1,4-benzoquinol methylase